MQASAREPRSPPLLPWSPTPQAASGSIGLHHVAKGGEMQPHAYVEFENEECAIMAVAALHDSEEGWVSRKGADPGMDTVRG